MDRAKNALAVVILAGGEARRLPGKLELDAGGVPLLVRVYRNVRDTGPVYISASRTFSKAIDAALECPVIIDRWPGRGPLAALYTTFEYVREPRVFVVAGDAPFVTAAVADELLRAWEPELQAAVPVNATGRLEPLCALYDRAAFLAVAGPLLREGSGSVAAAVERLRSRRVRLSNERVFTNVNTTSDRQILVQQP
jgi:molybdenum cofactor guanylyltransferase